MSVESGRRLRSLVVGGAGFIGSHLVSLMARIGGREISVLGRRPEPRFALPRDVRYVAGNLGDADLLAELLTDCDEVVDLAYDSVPKTSFDDPVKDVLGNLPSSVTLLKQCARFPLRRVLLVSSGGTVYGEARALPIDETHLTNPISPYGITKLAVEKYALLFHHLDGLPVVIVRPGNPYGPNQLGALSQGFIGASMYAVLRGQKVVVFGERGTVRDYLYVEDMVAGLLAALVHGQAGEVYNIGSGIGYDNLQVVEMLESIVRQDGLHVEYERRPARAFDVRENVLSPARLTYASGWRPKVDLPTGLVLTWAWAKGTGAVA